MATSLYNREVERLDEVLSVLAASPSAESRLVEEHAHAARSFKLGAMADEYELALAQAREAAAWIPSRGTRTRVEKLLKDVVRAHEAP